MDTADKFIIALVTAIAIVASFMGYMGGKLDESKSWKDQLIKKGIAEYNQTTGKWQFKEEFK